MFALLTFASTEGAETSKVAFYVTGLALTAFAVIVATLGIVRHDFPSSSGAARGVMTRGHPPGGRHHGDRRADLVSGPLPFRGSSLTTTFPDQEQPLGTQEQDSNGGGVATASDTLSVTDNRTGKTYEIPVEDGTIRTMALRDIKVSEDDFGLMGYDPPS
jgi:hypothetical protein